jgi:uncharacterized protein
MAAKVVHIEFPAEDADRAQAFYESLFSVSFQSMEGPMDYRMADFGEGQGGAVYPRESGQSGLKVYFDTDDIDAQIAKIRELGGESEAKAPVPGFGWFAPCKDPEGNSFSLWQSDASAGPPQG